MSRPDSPFAIPQIFAAIAYGTPAALSQAMTHSARRAHASSLSASCPSAWDRFADLDDEGDTIIVRVPSRGGPLRNDVNPEVDTFGEIDLPFRAPDPLSFRPFSGLRR